jgi:hypothetical protein
MPTSTARRAEADESCIHLAFPGIWGAERTLLKLVDGLERRRGRVLGSCATVRGPAGSGPPRIGSPYAYCALQVVVE